MRWKIGEWAANQWATSFPWGTLLINLTGSFVLGLYLTLVTERFTGRPLTRLLVATGVTIGMLCAFGVGRALAVVLYGVGPADPITFGSVTVMLAVVGLVACCIPALRASRTEPVTALRD